MDKINTINIYHNCKRYNNSKTMRRLEQQQYSFTSLKNPLTNKISLKPVRQQQVQNFRPVIEAPIYYSEQAQHQEKSTTCQSIYHGTNKQSIKNLLVATRSRNHYSENFISMTYQDIKIIVQSPHKPMGFFTSMLCGLRGHHTQVIGCGCNQGNSGRCPWMQHWLSLSMRNLQAMGPIIYSMPRQIDEQIRKDIKRTQPSSKTFETGQYQAALYETLVKYSRVDPQIGYVQGMNILSSILIYHCIDVNECVQVFKFLMFNCGFRNVYLHEFEFAYKLIANLIQALKYRCYDLYRHLVEKYEIDLGIFAIGWILPMLGNIVPLSNMHMVLNIFIERGWEGFLKILISMLLYIRPIILQTFDETELMEILRTQSLKNRNLPWEQIIISSHNVKVASFLTI